MRFPHLAPASFWSHHSAGPFSSWSQEGPRVPFLAAHVVRCRCPVLAWHICGSHISGLLLDAPPRNGHIVTHPLCTFVVWTRNM